MLVLTRRRTEQVVICDPNTGREIGSITLLHNNAQGAKLGFEFSPDEFGIHRREYYESEIRPLPAKEETHP